MSALTWIKTNVKATTPVPGAYPLLSPLLAILLNRQNAFQQLSFHVNCPILHSTESMFEILDFLQNK
jgi:hypothetical protein